MNHQDAVQTQTAEKYVLGQLRGSARDDFEAHFFECEECAEAVRTSLLFVDNAAAELLTTPAYNAQPKEAAERVRWIEWFRRTWLTPVFAVPVLALAAVAALWVRDHDRLKTELSQALAPQAFTDVQLDVTRGANPVSVVRSGRFFAVSFYINPDTLPRYAVEISGNGVKPATIVTPQRQNQAYHFLLPVERYRPGIYDVTVKGGPGTHGLVVQQFSLNLM